MSVHDPPHKTASISTVDRTHTRSTDRWYISDYHMPCLDYHMPTCSSALKLLSHLKGMGSLRYIPSVRGPMSVRDPPHKTASGPYLLFPTVPGSLENELML